MIYPRALRGAPKSVLVALILEDPGVLQYVAEGVERMGLELLDAKTLDFPRHCLHVYRNQLEASCVATYVRSAVSGNAVVLAVVGYDAYVPGLNFVFGLALPPLLVATVYTPRLRLGGEKLFAKRLVKEVMHELGHVYGLEHCRVRKCVMSFSNSLLEVDLKEPAFCPKCAEKLRKLGIEPRAVLGGDEGPIK